MQSQSFSLALSVVGFALALGIIGLPLALHWVKLDCDFPLFTQSQRYQLYVMKLWENIMFWVM